MREQAKRTDNLLQISRLSEPAGAEISGIDLSLELDDKNVIKFTTITAASCPGS